MTAQGGGHRRQREPIAIVGMTGRFPGAASVHDLWRVLVERRETLRRLTPEELCSSVPEQLRGRPDYVPVRGTLDGAFDFDAEYFQMTPREAEVMDPQQRLLLEAAVHVLEDAGIDPHRFPGDIGVFCGKAINEYLLHNVLTHRELVERPEGIPAAIANEQDGVATRIAYELDLRGPAVSVNTACSTSLVAVGLAVDALRAGRCDAALAGGVCVHSPQDRGYLADDSGLASVDGHVRPFDRGASGTVFSSGLGLVALKRLEDALRDRDAIRAVILGTATNNNGATSRSIMGSCVEGQARVVRSALADAGVSPGSIDYVEAHGTAARDGDPVELAALREAFGDNEDGRPRCALGSLKANIGHLGVASGVAGLIKTVQCLEHELLAPTIHCEDPDPALDLERGVFFVANKALPWPHGKGPRRAGVSAFGVGGTNAHIVLEEAPEVAPSGPSRPVQLVVQSARNGAALDRATEQLAEWFGERADDMAQHELADVAFTLRSGRTGHTHRRFAQGETARELARALHDGSADRVVTATAPATPPRVAFVFPGQGAQYVNMGSGLYAVEPRFRSFVDECAELLRPHLDFDIREVLLASDVTTRHLRQTRLAQPAVFVVEYSLARLWQAWGVEPDVLVGHSVGQYVAACLAGVLSLPDALAVVARRGTLMQALPPGIMLSTRLTEAELGPMLGDGVSLAAVNSPELCVASGPEESIEQLARTLKERDVSCRRLDTSHAFHSSMMDPMVGPFMEFLAGIDLSPPRIPVLCTVSGKVLKDEDACDPAYWACHVREPVRFAEAVRTLWEERSRVVLEVGPGRTMASLARQQLARPATQAVVSSLLETPDARSECGALLHAVGRLWLHGVEIDWAAFQEDELRRKVPLPGYPFEATPHWLAPAARAESPEQAADVTWSSARVGVRRRAASDVAEARGRGTPRREEIAAQLRASLQAASGVALDVTPTSLTFLELGLDSLLLTRWARSLRELFGVPVSLRQLLETEQTLEALATYMVQHMERSDPGHAVSREAGKGAEIDRLVRRLDELTLQLDELRGPAPSGPESPVETVAPHARPVLDPRRPPLPGARLGRAADGRRAWFVPDPARAGRYLQVDLESEAGS